MTALCVATHDDPTETAPGLAVCRWHRDRADIDLRDLPDIRTALLLPTQRRNTGPSEETPQPISDARRQARSAIRAVLVSWVLVLVEADRARIPEGLGDTQDAWCSDTVRRHLDWLLRGEHADQLCHDLEQAGTWRGIAEPDPPRLTVACECGDRVRVDPDQIMRCRTCGAWGVLSWWVEQAPQPDGPLTLKELPGWLLVQHGLDIPTTTLRTWRDRGWIVPVSSERSHRFEPAAVAAVAYHRVPTGRTA